MSGLGYLEEDEKRECIIEDNIVTGKKFICENNMNNAQTILNSLRKNPNFVGMIDANTDERITFDQMRDRSIRCALWLRKQGVVEDDAVVVSTPVSMDDYVPYLATIYINAIFNPWTYDASSELAEHYFDTVQPKIMFACKDSIEKLAGIVKDKGINCQFVAFEKHREYVSLAGILAEQTQEEIDDFKCAIPSNPSKKPCLITFTSGTTAKPKAVVHSHQSQLLSQLKTERQIGIHRNMICLWYASLAWVTGAIFTPTVIQMNCTRIIHRNIKFDPDVTVKIAEKYKINFFLCTPYQLSLCHRANVFTRHDFKHLKNITYSGTASNMAAVESCRKTLPHIYFQNGYGSSEAMWISSLTKNCKHTESTGFPFSGVKLKIIDENTGRALGPNQTGELYVKTDTLMLGYLNNLEETNRVIDKDGWLHTGDLAFYAEDGELTICSRIKELIKTKSLRTSSAVFEKFLMQHPDVRECAVIAVEHPVDIERPFAFVVTVDDAEVTAEELMDFMKNQDDRYELTAGLIFVDELPYTSNGKKSLGKLREMAKTYVKY